MKISESRRLRGEKKSKARQQHHMDQNTGAEGKYRDMAKVLAEGGEAAAKLDIARIEKLLKATGHSSEELQELVNEFREEIRKAKD
ncbi:MAG: hypothetical protein ACYTG5_21240 [Planctomycetota bacterium]|jgi:hypothetical protein